MSGQDQIQEQIEQQQKHLEQWREEMRLTVGGMIHKHAMLMKDINDLPPSDQYTIITKANTVFTHTIVRLIETERGRK